MAGAVEKKTVIERFDRIFASNEEDLLRWYKVLPHILDDELNFQLVEEAATEMWETLPIKKKIIATKEKDPYTRIKVTLKIALKPPRVNYLSAEDVLQVHMELKGEVEYSLKPWRSKETPFHSSPLYKGLREFVRKAIYTKKEKQRLEEECQELVLYIVDRIREAQGSFKGIGRSKREFYRPYYRK